MSANKQLPSEIVSAYAWYSVGVLFLVSVFAYMDRLLIGFLIEPIKAEFGLSDTQIGLVAGLAFAITYVLMGLPLGRLVDRRNRSYVLAFCISIWSLTTVLCGFTVGFISLFIMRVAVGIGEAGLHPAAVSIIGDLFPPKKLAVPMAVFIMGGSIGSGLAIIGGGALITWFSSMGNISIAGFEDISTWRLVFIFVGLPGLIVAMLTLFTVRDPGRNNFSDPYKKIKEEETTSLMEVLEYFRTHAPLFLFTLGGFIVHAFYSYGWHTWVPALLSRTYSASSDEIGLYYGFGYLICAVLGALSVGPLVKSFEIRGHRDAAVKAPLLLLCIMIAPAVLGPLMPNFALCILCLCITIYCYAAIISISLVALVQITPGNMRGLTSGIFIGVMNITGGAFGAVIVGMLSDFVFGVDKIGYALAVEGILTLPLAIWLFVKAIPHYRAALDTDKMMIGEPAESLL